jgi:two-component system response regulator
MTEPSHQKEREPLPSLGSTSQTHEAASKRNRILLVEDNPADVHLLSWALCEHGVRHELDVIPHGDEAMNLIRAVDESSGAVVPDIVVLDLNLPGFDGLQLLGAIRKHTLFHETRVGVYSSSDDPRDRYRAMELGADFYLQKPADLEGLRTVVSLIGKLLEGR